MPTSPADFSLVAALLYEGFYAFEFQLAAEVFGLDRPEAGPDWYRFVTCAEMPVVAATRGGIRLTVDDNLSAIGRAGTVIVPGWPQDRMPSEALASALVAAHAGGARLVSICSGAFLFAQLGLLAGRRATTHWRYADAFRSRFPEVTLDPDVLYVDDGDILTAAGSAAGLDLLLHLVRKDKGAAIANGVARRLVIPPHREGGQRQYVDAPLARERGPKLPALLDDIRRSLNTQWTIASMAALAGMSERSLSRRFNESTGMGPGEWLMRERVRSAETMLETSSATLADIAAATGLGTPENLARRFKQLVGVSPTAYRRTFRGSESASGPTRNKPA